MVATTTVSGRTAICGTGHTEATNAPHQRLLPGILSDLRLRRGPTQLRQQPEDFLITPSRQERLRHKGQAACPLPCWPARRPSNSGKGTSTD